MCTNKSPCGVCGFSYHRRFVAGNLMFKSTNRIKRVLVEQPSSLMHQSHFSKVADKMPENKWKIMFTRFLHIYWKLRFPVRLRERPTMVFVYVHYGVKSDRPSQEHFHLVGYLFWRYPPRKLLFPRTPIPPTTPSSDQPWCSIPVTSPDGLFKATNYRSANAR